MEKEKEKEKEYEIVCDECGVHFMWPTPNKKFCTPCVRARAKRNEKRQQRERSGLHLEREEREMRMVANPVYSARFTLEEIVNIGRNTTPPMSYGKMKAWLDYNKRLPRKGEWLA